MEISDRREQQDQRCPCGNQQRLLERLGKGAAEGGESEGAHAGQRPRRPTAFPALALDPDQEPGAQCDTETQEIPGIDGVHPAQVHSSGRRNVSG